MRGNDLALCWPNATGNGAIISQRSANSNTSPTPSASIAFNVQQAKSGLSSSNFDFTCTFSRPLDLSVAPIASTASSINVIYAVGLQPVKDAENGDPQQAAIQQHTYTGHGVLAIQRKSGLSSDPNNTISIPQSNGGSSILGQVFADDKIYEKLVQAHGFLCVLAGFGCILGAVYKNPAGPTLIGSSNHATLGVIIFTALVMQISYGIYIYHTYNPSVEVQKTRHRVLTWVHRLWGYSVLIAAVVQIALGLSQYGLWPTRKEGIWYAFYVVVAFWVVLFLIGSAVKFLRRPKGESVDESCKDDDVN
ncbi:hypothetical protein BGZ80_000459 [Entomortierella chlamydospora]|uniref:DOMON domain-containing protein n=1 Tax=Entomortierella chlamydospora TaxID=101097 RepID=A0A9P6SYK4_9FUNG|nr:hypothetical protein BGZ80_000459 [Entomortierella chlamydospora]